MNESERFFEKLDLDVQNAHQSIDGAGRPPSNMWSTIRTKANRDRNEEEKPMIASTALTATPGAFTGGPRQGFRHYANLAATIAIVVAVAFAGWFVTMQLNQSGGPEPRHALVGSTPEAEKTSVPVSATCDVEPLSIDTVMEIVKNPARFTANGSTGEPSEKPMVGSPTNAVLWEVDPDLELVGESTFPTEEQFDDASEFANVYLDCLISGTQGQIWTFYSPVLLQQKILGEFPTFAEESQVRERVEALSTQPAYQAEFDWELELDSESGSLMLNADPYPELVFDRDIGELTVNPDYQLAVSHQSDSSYYEYVITVGVSIKDSEGKQTTLTNGVGGDLVPNDPMISGKAPSSITVTIAKQRQNEGWMIIPGPSDHELGIASATPFAEATPTVESATCDVEPLSVDQVMEVVKNPFLYMDNGPAGNPVEPEISTSPYRTDLYQAWPMEQVVVLNDSPRQPTEQQLVDASEVANDYLDCLVHGTIGQAWVFYSPIHIQMDVLREFPVFANEDDVRSRVEERLHQPAAENVEFWSRGVRHFEPVGVEVNPDSELALTRGFSVGAFDEAVTFGVRFVDEEGQEVYLSSGNSKDLVAGNAEAPFYLTVTVAYSAVYDSWFVVPYIQW